jgi:hypothetical protein
VLIGYACISTGDQDLALQLDALKAAGCARWFSDTASGSLTERRQLKRALEELATARTPQQIADRCGWPLGYLSGPVALRAGDGGGLADGRERGCSHWLRGAGGESAGQPA